MDPRLFPFIPFFVLKRLDGFYIFLLLAKLFKSICEIEVFFFDKCTIVHLNHMKISLLLDMVV